MAREGAGKSSLLVGQKVRLGSAVCLSIIYCGPDIKAGPRDDWSCRRPPASQPYYQGLPSEGSHTIEASILSSHRVCKKSLKLTPKFPSTDQSCQEGGQNCFLFSSHFCLPSTVCLLQERRDPAEDADCRGPLPLLQVRQTTGSFMYSWVI